MGTLLGHPAAPKIDVPLCVGLDDTLVLADTLHLQMAALLCKPVVFLAVLFRLFQGIAAFKREVALRAALNIDALPYNQDLLEFLRAETVRGRRILLVTGADRTIAEAVARRLGLFEAVLASDGITNLKGESKVTAIQRCLGSDFEYAGDSYADLSVWRRATGAILVNSAPIVGRKLRHFDIPVTKEFPKRPAGLGVVLRAVRAYQWSKNLLVFAPLLLSHSLGQWHQSIASLKAFLALSAAASALYIFNDLLDLQSDRKHAEKRNRPIASGALSIRSGVILAGVLSFSAALFTTGLPLDAQLLIIGYMVSSTLYSVFLKRRLFLDVTVLAGLYAVRVVLGGVATGIPISPWLAAFSIFWFTSLAICKRLTELRQTANMLHESASARGYMPADLPALMALGAASGFVAVLVLGLYLNSPDVFNLYHHQSVLWLLCPLLAYWIGRILILANRGYIHHDPIVFAFRDRASRVVAVLTVAVCLGAL